MHAYQHPASTHPGKTRGQYGIGSQLERDPSKTETGQVVDDGTTVVSRKLQKFKS
jgi:hypothetical protein